MFTLVAALAALWLPRDRIALAPARIDGQVSSMRLGIGSLLALLGMVLLMEYHRAPLGAVLVLGLFALLARRSLARIDWLLLLTFAAIFLGLGGLGETKETKGAGGFGGAVWLGYDRWVGSDWSIGGQLRFMGIAASGDKPSDF